MMEHQEFRLETSAMELPCRSLKRLKNNPMQKWKFWGLIGIIVLNNVSTWCGGYPDYVVRKTWIKNVAGNIKILKMNEINERGQNSVVGPNNPGRRSAWIHSEKQFLSPSFGIHTRQPPVSNVIDHCGFAVCLVNNCAVQLWDAERDTEWRMSLPSGQEATRASECQNSCRQCEQGSRSRGALSLPEPSLRWGRRRGKNPTRE